jgi:predicted PurR-regulated permease PerM
MRRVEIPQIPARQLVWWTLGVTAVVICFWLLIQFQEMILLFITAVILSTAVRPGVAWLEKQGIAKPVGIVIIFGLVGILLGLLIWATVPVLVDQGAALSQSLAEGYQMLRQWLQESPNILLSRLLDILPENLQGFIPDGESVLTDEEMTLVANEGQGEQLLIGLAQAVAVVMLTFYWILESEFVKNAIFLLVPQQKRENARQVVAEIETRVGNYLLGQGLLCLIVGLVAFVAYLLIGLPHALLLAIFAGLLEAVPIAGPFLGAVPAVIIGLSVSPTTALWVILASIIIQQLENSYLVPRVMNSVIGIRPLVSLLSLLALGSLYGVLGALIALPLAGVIQLLLDRFLLARESLAQEEPGRDQLSVLRYETNQLVQDIRNQIRRKDSVPSAVTDALEDEVEALALDLEGYLAAQEKSAA